MGRTSIVCMNCGHQALQWVGRCPSCGSWDSLVESGPSAGEGQVAELLGAIDPRGRPRITSGVLEFDRVLGGGIIAGSSVLVTGEPGVGKSTLMLQAASGYADQQKKVLLVCGEESKEQVAARARRLSVNPGISILSATDVSMVLTNLAAADLAIIDSIQTLRDPLTSGEAGSVTQVRGAAATIAAAARDCATGVFLIGHVTKDGLVAGPRVLEHIVDAILVFEGDSGHALRTVRAVKNRFGATAEVGVFEMTDKGLEEVEDPSTVFMADRAQACPGSAMGCVLEGRRPMALEIQALTAGARPGFARRVANGIDTAKLGVILAVLNRKAKLGFAESEVYVSLSGGMKAAEPGIDLPLALSLASAQTQTTIPRDVAAIGEVGLAGDIRTVPGMELRLKELARLGFKRILVPKSTKSSNFVQTVNVSDINAAISLVM